MKNKDTQVRRIVEQIGHLTEPSLFASIFSSESVRNSFTTGAVVGGSSFILYNNIKTHIDTKVDNLNTIIRKIENNNTTTISKLNNKILKKDNMLSDVFIITASTAFIFGCIFTRLLV